MDKQLTVGQTVSVILMMGILYSSILALFRLITTGTASFDALFFAPLLVFIGAMVYYYIIRKFAPKEVNPFLSPMNLYIYTAIAMIIWRYARRRRRRRSIAVVDIREPSKFRVRPLSPPHQEIVNLGLGLPTRRRRKVTQQVIGVRTKS